MHQNSNASHKLYERHQHPVEGTTPTQRAPGDANYHPLPSPMRTTLANDGARAIAKPSISTIANAGEVTTPATLDFPVLGKESTQSDLCMGSNHVRPTATRQVARSFLSAAAVAFARQLAAAAVWSKKPWHRENIGNQRFICSDKSTHKSAVNFQNVQAERSNHESSRHLDG